MLEVFPVKTSSPVFCCINIFKKCFFFTTLQISFYFSASVFRIIGTIFKIKGRIEFLNLKWLNPLNAELNPICYLLALLGAHHFLHVSKIKVKLLTFRRLMSYIYGAPILDVSRSHTTTQHSR